MASGVASGWLQVWLQTSKASKKAEAILKLQLEASPEAILEATFEATTLTVPIVSCIKSPSFVWEVIIRICCKGVNINAIILKDKIVI